MHCIGNVIPLVQLDVYPTSLVKSALVRHVASLLVDLVHGYLEVGVIYSVLTMHWLLLPHIIVTKLRGLLKNFLVHLIGSLSSINEDESFSQ